MKLANRMYRAALGVVSMLLTLTLVFSAYLPAAASTPNAPQSSAKLTGRSRRGQPHVLSRVHVAGVLALGVVQQPVGDTGFVSSADDVATQFATAAKYGNIGLLAHDYLAGRSFSQLVIGETVRLIYRDGEVEDFVVSEVLRFQALQPENPWSSLRNLDNHALMTAGQVFTRVYAGKHHVTFQTCIEKLGNFSWGRLFVLAMPAGADGSQEGPDPQR